jgi:hypothetical protein
MERDKHQDIRLKEIEQYLTDGTYAETVLPNEKNGLRKMGKKFHILSKYLTIHFLNL